MNHMEKKIPAQEILNLQDARTLSTDKGADGHVDVGGSPLSTVETLPVAAQSHVFPEDFQVFIVLFFAHGHFGKLLLRFAFV